MGRVEVAHFVFYSILWYLQACHGAKEDVSSQNLDKAVFLSEFDQVIKSTEIKLIWTLPDNRGHKYMYSTIHVAKYNSEIWKNSLELPEKQITEISNQGMIANDEAQTELISGEPYWIHQGVVPGCSLLSKRECTVQDLSPNTPYRFVVEIESNKGSASSDPMILVTKFVETQVPFRQVRLFVQGTGRNNHANGVIKLNDLILWDRGDVRGLHLSVLQRWDLSQVHSEVFDTAKLSGSDIMDASIALTNTLLLYDTRFFVVLHSIDSWEQNFSEGLARVLEWCGAHLILEYQKIFPDTNTRVSDIYNPRDEWDTSSRLYHPYAFVGIPGAGNFRAYESLRTNSGQYLQNGNVPRALLEITIKYDPLRQLYVFHDWEHSRMFRPKDPYVKDAYIATLRTKLPELYQRNVTVTENFSFAVQLQTTKDVYTPDDPMKFVSQLDSVLNRGEPVKRHDQKGNLIQSTGPYSYELPVYDYLNAFFSGERCEPPYTATTTGCYDNTDNANMPAIAQCGIGINPQICRHVLNQETVFNGYDMHPTEALETPQFFAWVSSE